MEGIMMKSEGRTALCLRMPDGSMYMETEKLKPPGRVHDIPIVRGVFIFVESLATGVRSLMKSAELLESAGAWDDESGEGDEGGESEGARGKSDDQDRLTRWLENRFGEGAAMNFALIVSVVVAIAFTVGIFIVLPTWVMSFFGGFVENAVALNFIEGGMRIALFVAYIAAISRMKDIQTVFRFHGAEHECIHCYESGLDLTPENCQTFETLHPRCGTSFLMFVMVIALLLFSLLGWPDLLPRILSRIVLIPVIAGLSYELLRWAGRSTSPVVKILSVPGLLLQKLSTMRPDEGQLEVAIAAMKAVLVDDDEPTFTGYCDREGRLIPEVDPDEGFDHGEASDVDENGRVPARPQHGT
jgi:uncharacterized protein YqhQ